MKNILAEIVAHKQQELCGQKALRSLDMIKDAALSVPLRPSFSAALRSAPMGLIAEVKRRSPSAGLIREPFDPAAIAGAYQAGGAQAISCLMDAHYFGGGAADFRAVREAVSLPMLYKEFVVDPWQVYHARERGASAVLLIAAALPEAELATLNQLVDQVGLEVLFEVHDADEMAMARRLGARIVGINNRNLKTFETTLDTTIALREQAPEGCLLISESGIRTAHDVVMLHQAGIQGILVGEHLLRKDDLTAAVRELMSLCL
ncbi:MAG: indole-3-glycerol phosphate synthase [Kiritimatiellia bacterium]|jgi:indole-3-glycerol phosphate synthase